MLLYRWKQMCTFAILLLTTANNADNCTCTRGKQIKRQQLQSIIKQVKLLQPINANNECKHRQVITTLLNNTVVCLDPDSNYVRGVLQKLLIHVKVKKGKIVVAERTKVDFPGWEVSKLFKKIKIIKKTGYTIKRLLPKPTVKPRAPRSIAKKTYSH
ncbi:chemokine vCXCL13 [Aotine betaherpesvirus 1]|uniref:Chemokine vCXCL13 n=1 Tax=Aotine betaherpesvirus 1 TaxID=50290 RepID=G8XUJ2_9BETA|nr:chemokine vCXCL13 [Aotine betaherpesvirus 1]AEV80834.1 chemokine vCXCL13 [Aotine betaherpesvirus 1]